MKNINDKLLESLFHKNKHTSAFKNKDQQWDHWSAEIIINLVFAFEKYKEKYPEHNPLKDNYPENWLDEIIKYADKDSDFWDTVYCLYTCYYNGDFNLDDINKPGYTKAKFYS